MSNYIKVPKRKIHGELSIPTSKSYANRLLILASLFKDPVRLINLPSSTDVLNLIKCLQKIGIEFSGELNDLTIKNSFPACEKMIIDKVVELPSGDGGTTNRFLLPLLALGRNKYRLEAEESFSRRPNAELFDVLKELSVGLTFPKEDERFWLTVQGPLNPTKQQEVIVDSSRSTQFASGIYMALCETNIKVKVKNMENSKLYFSLTEDLVAKFKAGHREFIVPPDMSSVAFPAILAAISGEILFKNIFTIDELQADSFLFLIFKSCGIDFKLSPQGLLIRSGKKYKGFNVDVATCPDLFPALCCLASYADGDSFFSNFDVLKHKESDRLTEMLKVLDKNQIAWSIDQGKFKIIGRNKMFEFFSWDYKPPRDHRLLMTTYLFMRLNGGGNIYSPEFVSKSFPNFFDLMNSL
jgi:3-phosphoshikimate 1-carboxyvinyltransferase